MELKTSSREILQVLFYRKNVIMTLFVTVALGTTVATFLTPSVFEASATLLIEKEPSPPGTIQGAQQITVPSVLSITQEATEVAKTQSEIIKSRVVLRKALEQLKMTKGEEKEMEEKVAALQKDISVTPIKETTDLVRISVRNANPQTAADLTNAVAQAYVDWYLERRKGKASGTVAYLDKELAELGRELDAVESQLSALKERGGLVSIEDQIRTALSRLSEFEAEERKILSSEEEIETKLNKIRAQLSNPDETVLAASIPAADPYVDALRRKILDLELKLATLRGTYTEESAPVIQLKEEIEAAKTQLNQELLKESTPEFSGGNPIYQSLVREKVMLEIEQEALKVRKQYVEKYIDDYRSQLADLAEKEKEYDYLLRQIQAKENLYTLLQNRREEAAVVESLKEGGITTVKILDAATVPDEPVFPNFRMNIILGCVAGVVAGVGTASLFEYFDHSFKSVDDVQRSLGLPVLASIPRGAEGKFGKRKKKR